MRMKNLIPAHYPAIKTVVWIILLFSAFDLSSCQAQEVDNRTDSSVKILFIGNSLTYTNDLPSLIVKEGEKKGIKVKAEMLAYPNYALEDHWNDGKIQARIKKGGFDYVVVQQGPSSQAEGRELLLSYGHKIAAICKQANTRLAFFMVWPAKANLQTFDGVIKNYGDAATETGSTLCPVGEEWKKHFESTGDYSYYSEDEFHPSLKGSEVAARIILDKLVLD